MGKQYDAPNQEVVRQPAAPAPETAPTEPEPTAPAPQPEPAAPAPE
jgi:hypothetical protein